MRNASNRALAAAHLPAILAIVIAGLLSATSATDEVEPIDVSVRDVVIEPYAVDGKLVRLFGLLHQTGDGDALYWPEPDLKGSGESPRVAVRYSSAAPPSQQEANGSYVALEGIFYATKPPRRGWTSETTAERVQFNGTLVAARRVQVR